MWKFGQHMRSIRESRRLSLTDVGRLIGHTRASISAIELGRRRLERSPHVVGELERALQLEPGSLARHLPGNHPARQMIGWARSITGDI